MNRFIVHDEFGDGYDDGNGYGYGTVRSNAIRRSI